MLKLIILGAGSFAHEVREWYRAKPVPGLKFHGFLSDFDADKPGVIGTIHGWIPKEDERFVIGIGDPEVKKKIIDLMIDKGAFFESVIHPSVLLSEDSEIGVGVVIGPYSIVSVGAVIGNFTYINMHSSVGHNVGIGNYCSISSHVDLCGNSQLGECVFVGSSAAILPKIIIEDNAYVGAGSVVTTNTKGKVFGNPARSI